MQVVLLIALAAFARPAATDPDPVEIIRKAVEAGERNTKLARNYTYTERDEERSSMATAA